MLTIGIDLGTSAVKLLAVDSSGNILKSVSKDYPLYMDGNGGSEQDPNDWWRQTASALREMTASPELAGQSVAAVSFSGQMHGLVILDKNDSVLRRALLWNDQRTQLECDFLNLRTGREKLLEHTANIALTGFTAPKILWVKNHEPELFGLIDKIMLPKDYIAYKLSGVFATDYSDASGTLLLDVQNKKWSEFMLETIGLRAEQLPSLYDSSAQIGNVTWQAAAETGLSVNTKVIIGGGDQAVGAVGTGTVAAGMCSLSLGTSGVVFAASDMFSVDKGTSGIHSFCHANGRYHLMGVTLAAAASAKWWTEDVLGTSEYDSEQSAITNADLGNNKVYYLPYLSGERTPHNDPSARGAFVGMSVSTRRPDMTLAVLEGVAYSLRDNLEIMKQLGISPFSARITGGGAKSPLWCNIIANVLNLRVDKINSAEGPAFGAAILAMVGAGAFSGVEEACGKLISVTESYFPDNKTVERYSLRYPVYRSLYKALANPFAEMAGFN